VDDRVRINRAAWDERVPLHLASDFYDIDSFVAGRSSLRAFEMAELGSVDGLDLVHLQCHFGQDTLSWARLGARVVGLDFSEPAIEAARSLADACGLAAEFVCADVHDALEALGGRRFDVVYTGLGAIVWLPDIERWADLVSALLRPGGVLYLAEFHPFTDVLADDSLVVEGDYFTHEGGDRWETPGSYVDRSAPTLHNVTWEWVWPLGAVVSAVARAGLVIELLHEHDHTLWARWPFLEQHEDRSWRLPAAMPRLPLMYSLRARKPQDAS
jgi:SAM-dependent methyltransferase